MPNILELRYYFKAQKHWTYFLLILFGVWSSQQMYSIWILHYSNLPYALPVLLFCSTGLKCINLAPKGGQRWGEPAVGNGWSGWMTQAENIDPTVFSRISTSYSTASAKKEQMTAMTRMTKQQMTKKKRRGRCKPTPMFIVLANPMHGLHALIPTTCLPPWCFLHQSGCFPPLA